MTPDELRQLAEEGHPRDRYVLRRLAPDLARLCADMADVLDSCIHPSSRPPAVYRVREFLARLEALT